ncbi:tyrosinase family protein [Streptomyces violascens]|uniref:tyrosinase family protein n=1 Tax=Streptomyces violascens TaxID=67381 RepID=UPI0036B96CF8
MPRPCPPEFRARAVALVRAGKQAKQTAVELGVHLVTLSKWLRQDDMDNGRRPETLSSESAPERPAFWLHHAFIDELWAQWQQLHTTTVAHHVVS